MAEALIRALIAAANETIAAHRDELSELDRAIGDGDHGHNMARGFGAIAEAADEIAALPFGKALQKAGMTLVMKVGGASGPLYGTFFLRLATSFGDRADVGAAELGTALRAGLDGLVHRGKAELDDKTMVDAISPAVDAYEATAGDGIGPALSAAVDAAAAGRDRVTPLVARKGRASYLGERSANHQDPGATSSTILLEALRDAVAQG